jgi:hypothetical protein
MWIVLWNKSFPQAADQFVLLSGVKLFKHSDAVFNNNKPKEMWTCEVLKPWHVRFCSRHEKIPTMYTLHDQDQFS